MRLRSNKPLVKKIGDTEWKIIPFNFFDISLISSVLFEDSNNEDVGEIGAKQLIEFVNKIASSPELTNLILGKIKSVEGLETADGEKLRPDEVCTQDGLKREIFQLLPPETIVEIISFLLSSSQATEGEKKDS